MPGTWWAQPPLQVPLPADGARGLALLATGAQSCFVWLGRSWGIPQCLHSKSTWLIAAVGREVSLLSPEAAVAGLCSDGQCVLGLFAHQISVGSTVGGLGSRVTSGRERPEEAAGSQAFGYFCQISFGKSRQLWQLSDGGLVVEFVFLLTWIHVLLCPLPMGTLPGTAAFSGTKLSTDPKERSLVICCSHTCVRLYKHSLDSGSSPPGSLHPGITFLALKSNQMTLFSFNHNCRGSKWLEEPLTLFLSLATLSLSAFWYFDCPEESGDDPWHLDILSKTKEWFCE